jgi:hypothetical protein
MCDAHAARVASLCSASCVFHMLSPLDMQTPRSLMTFLILHVSVASVPRVCVCVPAARCLHSLCSDVMPCGPVGDRLLFLERHWLMDQPPGAGMAPVGSCVVLMTAGVVQQQVDLWRALPRNHDFSVASIDGLNPFAQLMFGTQLPSFLEAMQRYCVPEQAMALHAKLVSFLGPELPDAPQELFQPFPERTRGNTRTPFLRDASPVLIAHLNTYATTAGMLHFRLSAKQLLEATGPRDTLTIMDMTYAQKHPPFMMMVNSILSQLGVGDNLWGLPVEYVLFAMCVDRCMRVLYALKRSVCVRQ